MESSLLTILPNLSIGVISVLSLVYITLRFLVHLDERTKRHEAAMSERETALRAVEKEIRTELNVTIRENTQALSEVVRFLNR